jgi:hypothetical protein
VNQALTLLDLEGERVLNNSDFTAERVLNPAASGVALSVAKGVSANVKIAAPFGTGAAENIVDRNKGGALRSMQNTLA